VGAAENRYEPPVLFAEVLDKVLRNYVDPVESENLFEGAYEGLLASLDANGAYLTPEELAEWRAEEPQRLVEHVAELRRPVDLHLRPETVRLAGAAGDRDGADAPGRQVVQALGITVAAAFFRPKLR